MRPPQLTINGGTTNAVESKHGPGLAGFTNGDDSTYDADQDNNANATEVLSDFFDDVFVNVKLACVEGNGDIGPVADDVSDDPYELAAAVNTAANVLTGEASFVASGLRFDTSGVSLTVELSAGIYVFEGRKYHATAAMLSDIVVQVNGADAGNGDSFTLRASRDHYISIGPDSSLTVGLDTYETEQRTVSITVQDVVIDAAAPAAPAGEFYFAIITTSGTDVTAVRYPNRGLVLSTDVETGTGFIVRAPSYPDFDSCSLIPKVAGADLGAPETDEVPGEENGGSFIGTVYHQRSHRRTHTDANRRLDRVDQWTDTIDTTGAVNGTATVVDLDGLPNSSAIEVQVTAIAYTSSNQGYTRTVARMARKSSAGATGMLGSTREITISNPGAIAANVDFQVTGTTLQVVVTGVAATDITWVLDIKTVEMRGITP